MNDPLKAINNKLIWVCVFLYLILLTVALTAVWTFASVVTLSHIEQQHSTSTTTSTVKRDLP